MRAWRPDGRGVDRLDGFETLAADPLTRIDRLQDARAPRQPLRLVIPRRRREALASQAAALKEISDCRCGLQSLADFYFQRLDSGGFERIEVRVQGWTKEGR
jgi:hypothetical protein